MFLISPPTCRTTYMGGGTELTRLKYLFTCDPRANDDLAHQIQGSGHVLLNQGRRTTLLINMWFVTAYNAIWKYEKNICLSISNCMKHTNRFGRHRMPRLEHAESPPVQPTEACKASPRRDRSKRGEWQLRFQAARPWALQIISITRNNFEQTSQQKRTQQKKYGCTTAIITM